jgi:hypothetical protein
MSWGRSDGVAPRLLKGTQERAVIEEVPDPAGTSLRYLDAQHVEHRGGNLGGVTIRDMHDEPLGQLDGVLLDPSTRRVRYFVVERRARLTARRYLLTADTPATYDSSQCMLRFHAEADATERFDARTIPAFSDDDLLTALFA